MSQKRKRGLIKRMWHFLKEDTWQSLGVFLLLALLFIKFIFFPTLAFITGTQLPLVIVESCSMYHDKNILGNFDDWWFDHQEKYSEFEIV